MSSAENRKIIERINSGEVDVLSQFADDGVWIIPGIATYRGKDRISAKLFGPVMDIMESMGSSDVTNIIAEGDYVVVESVAKDRITQSGEPYNNTYCMVYKFVNRKIIQLTEYCDTALARSVFG